MSSSAEPVEPGESLINTRDVLDRIAYLMYIDETDPVEAEENAEEIEERDRLRALIADVGESYAEEGVTLVADHYWLTFACDYADEVFSLDETGAGTYFNYKEFADAYKTDFTDVKFGGVTYWHNYH